MGLRELEGSLPMTSGGRMVGGGRGGSTLSRRGFNSTQGVGSTLSSQAEDSVRRPSGREAVGRTGIGKATATDPILLSLLIRVSRGAMQMSDPLGLPRGLLRGLSL